HAGCRVRNLHRDRPHAQNAAVSLIGRSVDWLTFISKIVGDLVWPIVALVLILLLRPYLGGLANRLEELILPGARKRSSARNSKQRRNKLSQPWIFLPRLSGHMISAKERPLEGRVA